MKSARLKKCDKINSLCVTEVPVWYESREKSDDNAGSTSKELYNFA